ncbi:ABCC2 [Cordylochernes scorpioides]|uniref:ABCC2 n=1 Tax=Cordylochernes scorpioides TaxID=51811 RepID=A0ABY6LJM6_9ARAC|nr:ABCC2 [Cordylochernes scorpioides]
MLYETLPSEDDVSPGLALLIGVFLIAKAAMNASRSLHFYMLDSIMRSPMAFFDTTPLGRILNRCVRPLSLWDLQQLWVITVGLENLGTGILNVRGIAVESREGREILLLLALC